MPDAPERILLRSANWLGDAVMTTPAIHRLREARPGAHITVLSPEKLAGLWQDQPFVDAVLTFSATENIWQISRRLRRERFSVGVAFPNSVRSALELFLAGIPRRIGLARGLRGLFLTNSLPKRPGSVKMYKRSDREIHHLIQQDEPTIVFPPSAHHVHDYLYLTKELGASPEPLTPKIFVTDRQVTQFRQRFPLAAPDGPPWCGLNPGAEYGPAKRWPAERFIAAALALQKQSPSRWLIFGGPGDRPLTEEIARGIQSETSARDAVLNLAGQTNLSELGAALSLCRFVLTNDTGPMHLAAAVGTPVIALFGSTAPELTGPSFSPTALVMRKPVPCAPCFRRECPIDLRCLKGIKASAVVKAIVENNDRRA